MMSKSSFLLLVIAAVAPAISAQAEPESLVHQEATNLRKEQRKLQSRPVQSRQNVGSMLRNGLVPGFLQDVLGISFRGETGYQMNLAFSNVDDTSPFTTAQTTWSNIITTDVPDYSCFSPGIDNCGCIPCDIDDLHICATYATLGGNILGLAGPTFLRTSGSLPIAGVMIFDNVKIASLGENLDSIILHEMGHVVGIGTLWTTLGLANSNSPVCTYSTTGAASTEYQNISGCAAGTAIPLENDGGSGTACGHWDEVCFGTEIMTGFIGATNPFSRITIAGLQDLGYAVDFTQADNYTSSSLAPSCKCTTTITILSAVKDLPTGREEQQQQIPTRPKLSDEGRANAVDYGQSVLLENREKHDHALSFLDFRYDADVLTYVGDKIVNVLYQEGNYLYDVLVVSP